MHNDPSPSLLKTIGNTLLCYAVLIVLAAGGFFIMLQLRINVVDIFRHFDLNRWILSAIDRFGILILALLWLILVMALEPYLRDGMGNGRFWQRAGLVTGIEVVLLIVSYGLQLVLIG